MNLISAAKDDIQKRKPAEKGKQCILNSLLLCIVLYIYMYIN